VADQPVWDPSNKSGSISLSNSDRTCTLTSASGAHAVFSTAALSSGKWYIEFVFEGGSQSRLGVNNTAMNTTTAPGNTSTSWAILATNGNKITNSGGAAYGSGWSVNDVIMMAVDIGAGKVWWGKNGTWFASGDPGAGTGEAFSGLSSTLEFCWGSVAISQTRTGTLTDLASYSYSAPSGFTAGWGSSAVNLDVTPAKGALTVAGRAATIVTTRGAILTPARGALIIQGRAATILATTNQILQPASGAVFLAGQPAAFTSAPLLEAASGAVLISGQPAAISLGLDVTPATGTVQITGQPAVIETGSPLFVTPATGAVAITGQPATVETTANLAAEPATGAVTIEGHPVTLIEGQGIELTPASGSIAFVGQPVVVEAGTPGVVEARTGAVLISGQPVTLRADAILHPADGAVAIEGKPATVLAETNAVLTPASGRVSFAGNAATLVKTDNIVLATGSRRIYVYGHQAWIETSDNGGRLVIAEPPEAKGGQTWRSLVLEANPDWPIRYQRTPDVYEFSNGRKFGERRSGYR